MSKLTIDRLANEFIASMEWSDEVSDEVKSLVIGNIKGFAILVQQKLKKADKGMTVIHRDAYRGCGVTECGRSRWGVETGSEARTTCKKCLAVIRKRRVKWMKSHPNGNGLGQQAKMP